MAYDEQVADEVRRVLDGRPGVTEKKMFGGLGMLLNGNMAVAIRGKGGLMVRVDPADYAGLLAEPGAEPTEMQGRPMRGWITLAPSACASTDALRAWVDRAAAYTATLPPKRR